MSTLSVKRGSEGPHHDPYSYEEITVTRPNGLKVVSHFGLGEWVKVIPPKKKVGVTFDSSADLDKVFEQHAGISLKEASKVEFKKEQSRLRHHHKACGSKDMIATGGYPGESMDYCQKCGQVFNYHFDRSVVE